MRPLDVIARQALSQEDSPYGAVGVLHSGSDLEAWWIWKDGEEVEPTLSVMDRDDLLYVVRGSLCLELEGREPTVLRAGELFVIPARTPFRGYRWPRDGEPCLFLAVGRDLHPPLEPRTSTGRRNALCTRRARRNVVIELGVLSGSGRLDLRPRQSK